MIANSNNPQKRSESIGSLAWICGGGVILGASLIIAGIIINVATNTVVDIRNIILARIESSLVFFCISSPFSFLFFRKNYTPIIKNTSSFLS